MTIIWIWFFFFSFFFLWFLFFFLIIDLYFLFLAVIIKFFIFAVELAIPTGISTNKTEAEIGTHVVIVEPKISKLSV